MDNWKTISKIANMSGIVFLAFSALASFINYEIYTTLYSSAAPVLFIVMSILSAMLPFLACAAFSFTVAIIISRTIDSDMEEEAEIQESEKIAKQEADFDKIIT